MLKKSLLLLTLAVCMAGFNGNSEAAAAKALTAKQASIVTVAAFTAQGDLPNLKTALNEALDNGMTVNEVKEVLVQMYAYCGFPRSLNGINTLIAVLDERKAAGIVDEIGRDATPDCCSTTPCLMKTPPAILPLVPLIPTASRADAFWRRWPRRTPLCSTRPAR